MKVLVVTPYYKPAYVYGGPVQSFANLCEGLVEAGASVEVFTTNANGSHTSDVALQQPVLVDGVVVSYFPLDFKGLTFFYSASLSREIRRRVSEFDIVIAETLWGHALIPTTMACKQDQVPFIVSARGQFNSWALTKKGLKKNAYLFLIGRRLINSAAAIHCTDSVEVQAVKGLKLRPPTIVIPNGIRCSDYAQGPTAFNLRNRCDIPSDAPILLFLGRMTQIKRPDIALNVLEAVQCLSKDIHLVMVGPDEENWTARLRTQASRSGCEEKLHFTGLLAKEGVRSALSQAALLLMPSEIQENFGNSALEAMAAGIPILVSNGVPIGRWAAGAGAGRVIPCTKGSFQDAALELLSKPQELRLMGKRGQELVRQHFDVAVVARQMLAQYQAIITTGMPARPELALG